MTNIPNLFKFIESKHPQYKTPWQLQFIYSPESVPEHYDGNLDLQSTNIKTLGNLKSVGGDLDLDYATSFKSLGNLESVDGSLYLRNTPIESLGNLESVGGSLYLYNSPIKSLGNLKSVGGSLFLEDTPLSQKYTEADIRKMVDVKGKIYL